MIRPHGGAIVDREVSESKKERLREEAMESPKIQVDKSLGKEIRNLSRGRYSPITGFQNENNFLKVVRDMRLETGEAWTIPIVLDIDKEKKKELEEGDEVALIEGDEPIAMLDIEEIYDYDKKETVKGIYGTKDTDHPGVRMYLEKDDYLVAGNIDYLKDPHHREDSYDLDPMETRVLFEEKGWDTAVGFQTRNAPHRGHEYLQKNILENIDGILIHPKIGKKKKGDFTDKAIMKAYEELMDEYYLEHKAVLSTFPTKMRYMGPREAVFDALVRKNHGCTHFIVGRDHAGVGDYYGEFEAQEIFDEFPDIEIEPLSYDYAFYCEKCHGMVSDRTCPHGSDERIAPSGTKIRGMLRDGEKPPKELMRPEVAQTIINMDEPFIGDDE